MSKKLMGLVLALVMVFAISACTPSEPTEQKTTAEKEATSSSESGSEKGSEESSEASSEGTATAERPTEPSGQIIIGENTELTGDWLPHIQNNASDKLVWDLINGYGTVAVTFEGEFVVDDKIVVKEMKSEADADGNKTFTFTINEGLTFNDGTPITAKHYVADILLWASPQFAEWGGKNTAGNRLVGYEAFSKGEAKTFKGVRLLGDYQFSLTLDKENLPYFYELGDVSTIPNNWKYWTDDSVEIMDDGEGCYFSDNFVAADYKDKFNTARNGIKMPLSGPYMVTEYNEANKSVVLDVNPEYKGNFEGTKPMIQTVVIKKINQETSLDELKTGQIDILKQVITGDEINGGLDLVDAKDSDITFAKYPRAGYGKIAFACDFGPTKDKEVRQAIAHLLNRNEFAKAFTGGFGSVVNGPYGEDLWFYQQTKKDLNSKLNPYPYSLEEAKKLLDSAGWNLNEAGEAYAGQGLRYKKNEETGELMPLLIKWCSSENNSMSELLVVKLMENPDLEAAGIKIEKDEMSFGELLSYVYRDGSEDPKYGVPTYHMFNYATNFNPIYDMHLEYTTDPELLKQGTNTNFIIDENLEKTATAMVEVDSTDKDGFKANFVEFMAIWNDLLPDLPLYSNIYHDFYNKKIQGYKHNSISGMDYTIINAYVAE